MSAFDYLAPLVSILIGLVIADLAASLHRLLRAGKRVVWHWYSLSAALIVVLSTLSLWWGVEIFARDSVAVPLGMFLPFMCGLVLLYLVASVALPDGVPAEGLRLRDYYSDNARYFWLLYAGLLIVSTATTIVLAIWIIPGTDIPGTLRLNAGNLLMAVVSVSLAFIRTSWWHALWLVTLPVLMIISWSDRTVGTGVA